MANFTPQIAGNEEEIKASIRKFCKLWDVEEIQDEIQVEFSTRLTRSLGRTQPLQKIIRLNTELCATLNGHLEEVICHELAHVAVVHQHGTSLKPHGKEWQTLVLLAGYEPSIRMKVNGQASPSKVSRRYKHLCLVCHSQLISRSRMTRWRCSECIANGLPGELEIEELA